MNIDLTLTFGNEEVKRCVINCFVWPTFCTKLLCLVDLCTKLFY